MTLLSKKSEYLWMCVCLFRRISLAIRFFGRPVRVHHTSWVSFRSVFRVNMGGSITIGRNCEIHAYSMFLTHGGHITLGDNCSVNPFTIIYGVGGASIGNGVRIAAHSTIIPENHTAGTDELPLYRTATTNRASESTTMYGSALGCECWTESGWP